MAAHFKSKCARPLMAQPQCKLGALRVRIERAVVLILNYMLTFIHDVHFRGRRDIFIISFALIVGWKINLVLLNLVLLLCNSGQQKQIVKEQFSDFNHLVKEQFYLRLITYNQNETFKIKKLTCNNRNRQNTQCTVNVLHTHTDHQYSRNSLYLGTHSTDLHLLAAR